MNETAVTRPGARGVGPSDDAHGAWLRELLSWREKRVAGLAGPYGWWSLTCLTWLEEGENLVGSAQGATVRLPERFPAAVATVLVAGEAATVVPAAGALLRPGTDLPAEGGPPPSPVTVTHDQAFMVAGSAGSEPARMSVIRRGDLWGVRVHDPVAAAAADPAARVAWFAPAPEWVIDAEFLPADGSERVPVSNVIGQVSMESVAGRVRFALGGGAYTLLATHAGEGRLFINFRDASNEDLDAEPTGEAVSYSGGRFLITEAPSEGRVTLDLNRAHHPPCAHTPYATCPIPTPGNRLPFAVTAGERKPGPAAAAAR